MKHRGRIGVLAAGLLALLLLALLVVSLQWWLLAGPNPAISAPAEDRLAQILAELQELRGCLEQRVREADTASRRFAEPSERVAVEPVGDSALDLVRELRLALAAINLQNRVAGQIVRERPTDPAAVEGLVALHQRNAAAARSDTMLLTLGETMQRFGMPTEWGPDSQGGLFLRYKRTSADGSDAGTVAFNFVGGHLVVYDVQDVR